MRTKEMETKYFNLEMERMIKQRIFALEMDALTSRLQRLKLDNKIVTLLHELWDKMKNGGRCKVKITTNEDGIEVIIGELMVPTFYFTNEKKFWCQLRCIMKSSLQSEQWLQKTIHQLFVSDLKNEYFSHARWNTNDFFTFKHYIFISVFTNKGSKVKYLQTKRRLYIYLLNPGIKK